MNGEALLADLEVRHEPAPRLLGADRPIVGVSLSSDAVSRALEAWEADPRVDFTPAPRPAVVVLDPAPEPAKVVSGLFPAQAPAGRRRARWGGRLGAVAVLVLLLAMTLVAAAAQDTATVPPALGSPVTVSRTAAPSTVSAPVQASPAPSIAVVRGDSLWKIAERELGDPLRWPEIWEINRGRTFGTGRFLDPNLIRPGWDLVLPGG